MVETGVDGDVLRRAHHAHDQHVAGRRLVHGNGPQARLAVEDLLQLAVVRVARIAGLVVVRQAKALEAVHQHPGAVHAEARHAGLMDERSLQNLQRGGNDRFTHQPPLPTWPTCDSVGMSGSAWMLMALLNFGMQSSSRRLRQPGIITYWSPTWIG
ncbi:hypothetical protein D9M73_222690 [compost metagenome]